MNQQILEGTKSGTLTDETFQKKNYLWWDHLYGEHVSNYYTHSNLLFFSFVATGGNQQNKKRFVFLGLVPMALGKIYRAEFVSYIIQNLFHICIIFLQIAWPT